MTTGKPVLRILIADDHEMMREGTRAIIESQPGWIVCGFAITGRDAVSQAIELRPDIVVMDMTLPELNGLDAAIQIKRHLSDTEILILSGHASEELIREVFQAGAKGFINKVEAQKYLVAAIDSLSRHKPFFADDVSQILFPAMLSRIEGTPDAAEPERRLSAREREIVQLIAEGKSNKAVAEALGISARTAETHRANILRKLNLDSVASLVRYAIRNKIIEA